MLNTNTSSSLKMKTNHILRSEDAKNFIEALDKIHSDSMKLKRIKQNAIPETLIDLGLNKCFEQYFATSAIDTKLEVKYHFKGNDTRLNIDFEIMLFRATMKLYSNIIGLREAKKITIFFTQTRFSSSLSITYCCSEAESSLKESINKLELHEIEAELSIFAGTLKEAAIDDKTYKIAFEFLNTNTPSAHG
jgi:signal transduction histidine kinase